VPAQDNPERRRLFVLLAILAIVVIAAAAYYEIHHNSTNNSTPPASGVGVQTLAPQGTPLASQAPTTPALTQQQRDAQSDLRDLAVAEESYFTFYNHYTTSSAELDKAGYRRVHFKGAVSYAGVHGKRDFCLVGSAGGKAPFFLFDSASRGMQKPTFPSRISAGHACSDPTIKKFTHIT
jgi:hypothetical protein